MSIDHYSVSGEPVFELVEGDRDKAVVIPLFSIPKIVEVITEIGRRGVQIKRFKGLVSNERERALFNDHGSHATPTASARTQR